MRLVQFSTPTAGPRPGVIDGDTIRPLDGVASLDALVALEPAARDAAVQHTGDPVPLAGATLLAPLHPRKNVFCVGRNYLAHAEEGARVRGEELKLPTVPTLFTKAPTAITGPGATLNLDGDVSQKYDWEAELAVVIGTTCKDVREEDALGVIFGYTCLNDVSARDLQNATPQWFKGKTLDDTCPLGPWIVTADEIGDPQKLDVSLRAQRRGEAAREHGGDDLLGRARDRVSLARHDARSRATSSRPARPKASASRARRPSSSKTAT